MRGNGEAGGKRELSKKKGLILGIAALIAVTALIVVLVNAQERREYEAAAQTACDTMTAGMRAATELGALTVEVWHDVIYGEQDNDTAAYTEGAETPRAAIDRLYTSPEGLAALAEIRESRTAIAACLPPLEDPPDRYREVYDTLQAMHAAYLVMSDFALEPTGTVLAATAALTESFEQFDDALNEFAALLPAGGER